MSVPSISLYLYWLHLLTSSATTIYTTSIMTECCHQEYINHCFILTNSHIIHRLTQKYLIQNTLKRFNFNFPYHDDDLIFIRKTDYPQKYFRTCEKNIFDIHSSKITHHPHIHWLSNIYSTHCIYFVYLCLIDDESKIHTK